MSGPIRLLEEGTDFERLLIASARSVRPNRIAKARVGMLLLLSGMGFAPSAEAAVRSSARTWGAAKWLAAGLGAGAMALGGAKLAHHSDRRAAPDAAAVAAEAAPARDRSEREELLPGVPPPETTPPSPAQAASVFPDVPRKERPSPEVRPGRENAPTGFSLDEIEELDGARRAIEAGDPNGALQRLDRYSKNHPKGALEQEHLRLRIEALAAQGSLEAAQNLLRRFLTRYPQSAHRKRLQSLVGGQP